MHGEHCQGALPWGRLSGSPPYARGTRSETFSFCSSSRITPVCTGNTHDGECEKKWQTGSPPYARGTLISQSSYITCFRITPVCTGNTPEPHFYKSLLEDHPRMHGEHNNQPYDCGAWQGSPPYARGTPMCKSPVISYIRITPVCTGNTDYQSHCIRR